MTVTSKTTKSIQFEAGTGKGYITQDMKDVLMAGFKAMGHPVPNNASFGLELVTGREEAALQLTVTWTE